MGYDNECIVNIQSLPGEYFCPVCRTLVYPNEALQSQCTHLYCKPCLAYVVATTHACPYDGYLVTEADSKPLTENNKELAETIGKTAVHCLYHRSGCQWQGTLSESTVHCAGCSYGNSAVVCNRCGTQIIHRQVQEHAQICPGIQPQAQTTENAQAQSAAAANLDPSSAASGTTPAAAAATTAALSTPAAVMTATPSAAVSSAPVSAPSAAGVATAQVQPQGSTVVYPQAATQAPTPEQWYQQQQMQYQQYYQQYPGYDPYQQQYQQYAQYQQQAYPQYVQPQVQAGPQHVIPGQQQPQPYMQQPQPIPQLQPVPQPGQVQSQAQPQNPQVQPQGPGIQPQLQQQHVPQPQPQMQPPPHPQAQTQAHVPAQVPQMQQPTLAPTQQPHPYAQTQAHSIPHGHAAGQLYQHPQPHAPQTRPPQLQAPPQHQQTLPPQQLPQQMPHPQAYPQPQPRPQQPSQSHPLPHPQSQLQQPPVQMQPQPQPHHPSQPVSQMQPPYPPAHGASGYQSYPQPLPGPPPQRPTHMPQQQGMPSQYPPQSQSQFPPQQPAQMRPVNPQIPVQQQPTMPPPPQGHPPQQQVQHSVHQSGQQAFQQPAMHPHGSHGLPQPQAQGILQPGHPSQQGGPAPQHQLHPQQSLRQGQPHMHQPAPGQPLPAQGLPPHQAQARPMMVSQGLQQQPLPQPPATGPKLTQPGVNQQSPSQNYIGRANPPGTMSSELQSRSIQQSQLPHSGSQGGLVPASPGTPKKGTLTDDGKMRTGEGTEASEKISEDLIGSKSKNDEGKDISKSEEKDGKDGTEKLEKEEDADNLTMKQVKVEEGPSKYGQVSETSHDLNAGGGEKETKGQEGKRNPGPDKSVQQDPLGPILEKPVGGALSQAHAPGVLGRGQFHQQPSHRNLNPAQGRGYPEPVYNDRNPSQFPQQYPGSDDRQMPSVVRQQVPHEHPPHMPDPTMMSQRPPAPDRMFSKFMQPSNQERFPEPSSQQLHMHGPAAIPSQMRPPGHNEVFSHQGQKSVPQEPFWPPPHAGASGPSPLPHPGGFPSHHAFPPKAFDQQAMGPQGQTQSHPPPPHAGGMRTAHGDPLAPPFMGGPPPGPMDAPSRRMGGPPFISEDKMGKSASVNAIMEAEAHKRHGVYDGRQLEHASYREPNPMKLNDMPNNGPVGGMHDSTYPRGLPDDRFRPLPEERFKPFTEEVFKTEHDERFRPSSLDPGRHIAHRREFEEDLKQFPRPAHLDGEGPTRFDGYHSSSRPLDRMPPQPGAPNAMTSRPLPSYQSGAPFAPGVGGPEGHMDIGNRDRPIALYEHLGRRPDGSFPHPDRLNPVPEFGRHRADGLPPLRSPGRFNRDIDGVPGQPRRGMDGVGPLGPGLSSNVRGSEQNMPSFLRGGGFGGFRGHLDTAEPGNLPPHMRIGEPGFNGRFNPASREGEFDTFEQSRKRKAAGTVRCLICKIDCETVEGLELHSQGREHQKVAMDIVLNIKKENAKKLRTSEGSTPFDGSNASRKANFEKRGNRQ